MKTYKGWRCVEVKLNPDGSAERVSDEATGTFVVVEENGQRSELDLHLHVRNHSPTGFNWGYAGSGPAQLALAICCDCLGEEIGSRPEVYQRFKEHHVSRWAEAWRITGDQIDLWYAILRSE